MHPLNKIFFVFLFVFLGKTLGYSTHFDLNQTKQLDLTKKELKSICSQSETYSSEYSLQKLPKRPKAVQIVNSNFLQLVFKRSYFGNEYIIGDLNSLDLKSNFYTPGKRGPPQNCAYFSIHS